MNAKNGAGVVYLDKGGARDIWEAGHTLNVTNASLSAGAGFVVVIAGNMMLSSSALYIPCRQWFTWLYLLGPRVHESSVTKRIPLDTSIHIPEISG